MSTRARIGLLTGGLFLLAALLVGKLFDTAVLQHGTYIVEAQDQQGTFHTIEPTRGQIYAQDGSSNTLTLVAESVERFSLSVTPANVVDKPQMAKLLASISNTDETTLLNELNRNGKYLPPLMHDLTQQQVQTISGQINALVVQLYPKASPAALNFDRAQGDMLNLVEGVYFTRDYQRVYPEGQLASQVLGFVNNDGTGQYGIESQFDNELKGYAGQVEIQQDSTGAVLSEQQVVQEQDGQNIQLTIDRNIQYVVEQDLAAEVQAAQAKDGQVIIEDPKTGDIVAMASYPTFDPNNYGSVTDASLYQNPSVNELWEPGSIFKPMVMAAALDQNLVTADTSNTFGESVTVDGSKIETALRKSYGLETMTDVLVNSDNVGMVWVSNLLGNQTMSQYINKWGFGSKTGIDLTGEINGFVMPVAQWRDINRATISFGQGISVTPIQIIDAYSAIATDGKLVTPHIVKAIQQSDGTWQNVATTYGAQVIKPATATTLQGMLTQVVAKAEKKAGVPGYVIAGKTGTAQVPDPVNGGYIPDAYNHSFVGFAPVGDPKFVMLTKIDQPNIAITGTYAESTAVPLFGQIAQFLLQYYQIPPTQPVVATPTPAPTPTPSPTATPSASPTPTPSN